MTVRAVASSVVLILLSGVAYSATPQVGSHSEACTESVDLLLAALLADRVRLHTAWLRTYLESQDEQIDELREKLTPESHLKLASRSRAMANQTRAIDERIADVDRLVALRKAQCGAE